jgi:hypothetical protein
MHYALCTMHYERVVHELYGLNFLMMAGVFLRAFVQTSEFR